MKNLDGEIFSVWFLAGAALVFWMQAGFAMCEAGFTRAKNAGNNIMKNLMDFCIGTVMWFISDSRKRKERLPKRRGFQLLNREESGKLKRQYWRPAVLNDWQRGCVTTCVTKTGQGLNPASFLCFFNVLVFESRLALFLFTRKSSNHAGFRALLCQKEVCHWVFAK